MTLAGRTVSDLLAAFRSSDPTPGGGSAAALAGAVGASLLAMVSSLPKPRASSEKDLEDLRGAGSRCTALALELESLIDRDAEAYDMVVAAYRLPKGSADETATRAAGIQGALTAATEAPLDVMRRCAAALQFAGPVARLGNANAASDVRVAEGMLRAGLAGAAANVEINLGSVKDEAYVQRVRNEARALSESAGAGAPTASS